MTMLTELRGTYAAGLEVYLGEPTEGALQAAYELGREAVSRELSVLDLAAAHHDALRASLTGAGNARDAQRIAGAAAEFFLESISAFEMLQRGFRETQAAAVAEQRQAAMLRGLSSFLGDASLALDEAESLEEMLQLVAEQARELIGAECCCAFATLDDATRIAAIATSDGSSPWNDVGDHATLFKLASLLRSPTGTTRLSESALTADPAAVALGGLARTPLRALLAAPLTSLDGRELGSIHLFDPRKPGFSDVDEAQLLHLTRLASAALERVALYGRGRRVADALERARHDDAGGAGAIDVVVRHRPGETGDAVWFDTIGAPAGRVLLVAGEVRGPASAVAATQARAAAVAFAGAGMPPARLVVELAAALARLAPDNPGRAAAALFAGDRAETAVDGVGEAVVALGDGTALVLHAGGGLPPAVAVEAGGAEPAATRVLTRLGGAPEAELAVLAAARRR